MKLSKHQILVIGSFITLMILSLSIGILSSFIIDTTPPKISSVAFDSEIPINTTNTIVVFVNDASGIKTCTLCYQINESTWCTKNMRHYTIICCPPRYLTKIGPMNEEGTVKFLFEITDNQNNTLRSDVYSFMVQT